MRRWPQQLIVCALSGLFWLVAAAAGATPAAAGAAPLAETEANELFHQAKDLFRQANQEAETRPDKARETYVQSLLRLERLVREGGIRNGRLYYNIGNVHFRMGDIGRAILYYRRAQELIPHDVNLRQNLEYARSRRIDKIEAPPRQQFLHTVFFWHYDLAIDTRSQLFLAAWLTAWLAAVSRLWRRLPGSGWVLGITAVLAAALLASIAVETWNRDRYPAGVVLAEKVVARKGDSQSYEPSFTDPLHAGVEFQLVEDRQDWLQIRLDDGRQCWLPATAAELVGPRPGQITD